MEELKSESSELAANNSSRRILIVTILLGAIGLVALTIFLFRAESPWFPNRTVIEGSVYDKACEKEINQFIVDHTAPKEPTRACYDHIQAAQAKRDAEQKETEKNRQETQKRETIKAIHQSVDKWLSDNKLSSVKHLRGWNGYDSELDTERGFYDIDIYRDNSITIKLLCSTELCVRKCSFGCKD